MSGEPPYIYYFSSGKMDFKTYGRKHLAKCILVTGGQERKGGRAGVSSIPGGGGGTQNESLKRKDAELILARGRVEKRGA